MDAKLKYEDFSWSLASYAMVNHGKDPLPNSAYMAHIGSPHLNIIQGRGTWAVHCGI